MKVLNQLGRPRDVGQQGVARPDDAAADRGDDGHDEGGADNAVQQEGLRGDLGHGVPEVAHADVDADPDGQRDKKGLSSYR